MGIGGWLSVGACLLVGALSLYTLLSYAPEVGGQGYPLAGSATCTTKELGDILAEVGMPMR